MGLEHYWEDNAMENDIVLAYEVNKACVFILPPFLPCAPLLWLCITKFLGVGDISDGGVKPYVEHLSLSTLNRHGDSPFQVAGHSSWLKVHVQPTLALSIYVGAPFLVSIENPLLEPILIFTKWQIPVLGRLLDKSMTGIILVGGIDQLVGREGGSTFLTLVAISALGSTSGACAHDIAVGEEFTCHLVAILLFHMLLKFSLVVESTEKVGSKLMVDI